MTGLELFLTVAVVVALAGLAVVAVLLRRCLRELKLNHHHLSLLEQDTDGQLEVLDRIDRLIHSRARALFFDADLEETPPPGVMDSRPEPRDSTPPGAGAG